MSKSNISLVVPSADDARKCADYFIGESAYVAITPYPDDCFAVEVKYERAAELASFISSALTRGNVPAVARSSDGAKTVKFNASWALSLAEWGDIVDLHHSQWCLCPTADRLVEAMKEADEDISNLLEYIHDKNAALPSSDHIKLETRVDDSAAVMWVKANRPDVDLDRDRPGD